MTEMVLLYENEVKQLVHHLRELSTLKNDKEYDQRRAIKLISLWINRFELMSKIRVMDVLGLDHNYGSLVK